jgi:hypothetical protein
MLALAVSDSTYRDQEELLFRTAAQLKGVFFYRGLLLILLPILAWLSSRGVALPSPPFMGLCWATSASTCFASPPVTGACARHFDQSG